MKLTGVYFVAGVAFLIFGTVLVWVVLQMLRGNREDILATMVFLPEQEITLLKSGEAVLLVEGPRFTTAYVHFEFEVVEKQSGLSNKMKYHILKDQGAVYGVSTMKVPYGRMTVPRAGTYVVRASGLNVGQDYSSYHILLSRPYIGRMTLQIVGIVFCGVGMLLTLLWACWQLGLMKPNLPSATQQANPSAGVPGRTIDLDTWKRQQQQPPK
jgi:hypothetical protein